MKELLEKLRADTTISWDIKMEMVYRWVQEYRFKFHTTTQSKEQLTANLESLKLLEAEHDYYVKGE